MADYNSNIISEFRGNKGKVGGYFENMDLLLFTAKGAKSGQPYTHPVAYTKEGNDYVIVASKGGSDTNPAWFHNLKANPKVTVEVGEETFQATANLTSGTERERLFEQHAKRFPVFREYKQKTSREIPVFVLRRA